MSSNTTKNGRTRLLELRAKNIKTLKEIEIDLSGDVHEVRGDTAQGKTSILDSIEGALRGLDPAMVRRGESAAELELLLDTATVKRVVPADGSRETLLVTGADGAPVEKGKDFLRSICGPSAFRPIAWVHLGAGEAKGKTERLRRQRDELLEALEMSLTAADVAREIKGLGPDFAEALGEVNLQDVDFAQHPFVVCGALERACYEYRKAQNAVADDGEAALQHTPAPERPAPRADLAMCQDRERKAVEAFHTAKAGREGRKAQVEQRDRLRAKVQAEEEELPDRAVVERTLEKYTTEKDEAATEISRLEELLNAQRARLGEATTKARKCEALLDRLTAHEARKADLAALEAELSSDGPTVDLEALRQAMESARGDTEARRLQDVHDVAAKKATDARARSKLFDRLVELFRDDLPKKLIGEADLPVEGLGVDGDKILINGVPLHQLGTSEQIRIGVLIAAALNPRSGFVLVDGAESMGRKDRVALAAAAKELGLQLILTVVDPDAKPAEGVTVMRDGVAVR